jgi:hypothetical protein
MIPKQGRVGCVMGPLLLSFSSVIGFSASDVPAAMIIHPFFHSSTYRDNLLRPCLAGSWAIFPSGMEQWIQRAFLHDWPCVRGEARA